MGRLELNFLRKKGNAVEMDVFIQPGAPRNSFLKILDNRLKIGIKALPSENKANMALIEFLSKSFKIPKYNITIAAGLKSRKKTILIEGIEPEKVREILLPFLRE